MKRPSRSILRGTITLALVLAVPLLWLASCQSKLIYFPRPYAPGTVEAWAVNSTREVVTFTTSQGTQRAFLQGNLQSPRNLWIVCGGNGTLALEWSEWLVTNAPLEDAWLLVDFPGYGICEGKPSPTRIRETFQTVVPIAASKVGISTSDNSRLRFFGHSLGAAAVLTAATGFDIRQGVLLAPFTSTMDMAHAMIGLPVGFLVTHRFDNAARLDELIANGPARVAIVHGTHDEVIPVGMARTLASSRAPSVRLIEIPGGRHNDISINHGHTLAKALDSIGSE